MTNNNDELEKKFEGFFRDLLESYGVDVYDEYWTYYPDEKKKLMQLFDHYANQRLVAELKKLEELSDNVPSEVYLRSCIDLRIEELQAKL
jgi:hypothetical protein